MSEDHLVKRQTGTETLTDFEQVLSLLKQCWEPVTEVVAETEARAMAYISGQPYHRHDLQPGTGTLRVWTGRGEPILVPPLARSRDALKAARPESWWLREMAHCIFIGRRINAIGLPRGDMIVGDRRATDELSELDCLLKVHSYLRGELKTCINKKADAAPA